MDISTIASRVAGQEPVQEPVQVIKTITYRWEEPETGVHTTDPISLTADEWKKVEEAVDWVRNYWESAGGDDYGTTIVETTINPIKKSLSMAPDSLQEVLEDFALQSRYTDGSGIYEETCPVFRDAGIRSV